MAFIVDNPVTLVNQEAIQQGKCVTIYTTPVCPYCVRAKNLLNQKNISYKEIDVSLNPQLREALIQKTGGRRTVPQIFFGDHLIGGCDDLYELESLGELDKMLTQIAQENL